MAGQVSRFHKFFMFYRLFRFWNQSFHCVFKSKSKKPPLKHKLYGKFGHMAYVLKQVFLILIENQIEFIEFQINIKKPTGL